jgi:anti-sigma regulatory factor (Ser/Thr protein kinase)
MATFAPVPENAVAVRRFVAGCLAGRPEPEVDLAVLLASELATNAIIHVGLPFTVQVDLFGTCIWVGVDDASAVLAAPLHVDPLSTSGRGMAMVEALADRWGIEPTASGKRAWFELCSGSVCVGHRTVA